MKKLLISFLLGLVFFSILAPNFSVAKAAGVDDLWIHQWYGESNPFNWYAKVYDTSNPNEIFGERYTAAQVQWVTYSVFSMVWNLVPGNPGLTLCLTQGSISDCTDTVLKGLEPGLKAMGLISQAPTSQNLASAVFGTLKNNPISSVAYAKNLVQKFSPVSTVRAQGVGFSAADSILLLWRAVRNISYSLVVVAAIVLAFMVMFRVKLSPQVVISVQSAIPKLIIALILITFSYAIAGLLIDLMYVVIGLFALLVSKGVGGLSGYNPAELFNGFTSFYSALGAMYLYMLLLLVRGLTAIWGSGIDVLWGVLIFIFAILMIFATIWWSIKLFIEMAKNFAFTLLTIVTGPLEIMLGTVVPSMGFGRWFKRLASYLSFYVVIVVLLFLSFFFLFQGGTTGTYTANLVPFHITENMISGNTFTPPMSFGATHNDGSNMIVWLLVSIVIFSNITKAAQIVRAAIYGEKFNFGSELGATTGATLMLGGNVAEMGKKYWAPLEGIGKSMQALGKNIH